MYQSPSLSVAGLLYLACNLNQSALVQTISNANFQTGFNLVYNAALGRSLRRIFNT